MSPQTINTGMHKITFYYDIVCPYAYIASQRIEALAARSGATVDWTPVLLGGIYKSIEAPQVPSSTWSAAKARLGALDLHRQARYHRVPLRFPTTHPRRTVSAMRLLVGASGPARVALSHALYQAYWVEGLDISDRSVLNAIAINHGVDPACIDSPRARAALFKTTEQAVAAGAFGVPSMVVDGVLWWGQDRLNLVERAISGRRPPESPSLSRGGSLRFFHDFSSPFSYLASTQIARIAARNGVEVEWLPILLGGLFRSIGTPDVPLLTMSAAKQAYVRRDLSDWADWWGVPFSFPTTFPVRTVLPLRISIAEPAATPHLYRALWAEDRDIGSPEVVTAVLTEAGLDAAALIRQASDPDVKAALRANTEAAETAGVCGVPTVEVGGELIWGQDRLEQVDAALSGLWSTLP